MDLPRAQALVMMASAHGLIAVARIEGEVVHFDDGRTADLYAVARTVDEDDFEGSIIEEARALGLDVSDCEGER